MKISMIEHQTTIKIRYGETDKMGYVHHSNYPLYLEEARMDLLQKIGMNYKEVEDTGVILPLVSMNFRFYSPLFYDDVITIKTALTRPSGIRLIFDYAIFNQQNKLVCKAETALVFADMRTGKPLKPPNEYLKKFVEEVEIVDP